MKLYSFLLCPFCRSIRVLLSENSMDYININIGLWTEKENFKTSDEWNHLPVLMPKQTASSKISGFLAISNYINDVKKIKSSSSIMEANRIAERFNTFFFADVTWRLVYEKVVKKYVSNRSPDSSAIRYALNSIDLYFEELSWLIDHRTWLAGENFSIADIVVASHISCIDYLNEINWSDFESVKNWYMSVKCRPSFQPLLKDRIQGISPSKNYSLLDF